MARTGICFEEVRDAAEALLSRGLNPTIQRVREQLGTGSNTTISGHLKQWQQQLAEAPKIILPPAVPEAVALALDTFWKIAVQHAEAAFEEQRAQIEQALAAAEQARDSAIAEQRQLQDETRQTLRQLEVVKAAARELADRLLVEQERRAAAETEIQAAAQRAQEAIAAAAQVRVDAAARLGQLEQSLQQTRADLEQQLTEAGQRLQAEQQRSTASEARLTALLDQLRAAHSAERQDFARERQEWRQQETQWREQQETERRETARLQTELTAAAERQQALAAELARSQLQLETATAQHLAAVRTAEAWRGELNAVREDRDHLRQKLAEIHDSPSAAPATPHSQKSSSDPAP